MYLGSIPARAGKPELSSRVYPVGRLLGLSPRVRGNPRVLASENHSHGSIPARAGKPGRAQAPCCAVVVGSIPARAGKPVDPAISKTAFQLGSIPARAGEPRFIAVNLGHRSEHQGLSPRVRGNLAVAVQNTLPNGLSQRSIEERPTCSGLYPRACGETPSWALATV